MTRPRMLPARVVPVAGESLWSFVRRTAVAMGYERVRMISELVAARKGLPPHIDHLRPGPVMERLAELCGSVSADLKTMTVHRYAPQFVLHSADTAPATTCDSRTILRFVDSTRSSVCPQCLQQEPGVELLRWSLRPVLICPDHGCWLRERCPGCHARLSPTRMDLGHCRCGFQLSTAPAERASNALQGLADRLERWLQGQEGPLPECSPAAGFCWLERLAVAVLKTPTWMEAFRNRYRIGSEASDSAIGWLAATELLVEWPGKFEEFLEVFQTVAKHRSCSTGVNRSFGTLLRDAARLEDLGYGLPANTLRTYLIQRYCRGHLTAKVCLFRKRDHQLPTTDRPWLTQTEAARYLRLRSNVVPELLKRGLLTGEMHVAGQRGRSIGLVSRESVELLQRELRSSLTVCQAAQLLGIGRHRILEMIADDLLPRCLRTAKGWSIPSDSVTSWQVFVRSLPLVGNKIDRWITVREATRRFGKSGLTVVRLLRLVRGRKVRAGRTSSELLGQLLVHEECLYAHRGEFEDWQNAATGYPLHRLARELIPGRKLKVTVLHKWIAAGLLAAVHVNGGLRVLQEEVERFRAEYWLADEVCRQLQITRSTLSRRESNGRIVAAYGRRTHAGAGASLFRRDDVERLKVN
ncbi:MAG: TniQ family protein [Planctomycetaceae bacterium]|nr:TniQ family protein [Planctomycetaceae bacterium]